MATRPALKVGERRTATILFADMKGFTSLSERMDPEEIDSLMNSLFSGFESIIKDHGGIVEKYIGDALVAVFGVPELHEDDPQRAIEAALTFLERQASRSSGRSRGTPEASFRIGIHTGLVATGTRGNFDVVTGHAMAVAQRIQAAAEPDGILVSDSVKQRCEGDFEFAGPVTLTVKGKSEPISAWAVKGQALRGLKDAGPFIGRKDELDELLKAYIKSDSASLAGRYLVGEAGIGKSRLAQALAERIGSFPEFSSPLLIARAQKYRTGEFAVVTDLILERLGLDSAARVEAIEAALVRLPGVDRTHAHSVSLLVESHETQSVESDAILALFAVFSSILSAVGAGIYSPFIFIDNAQAMDRRSRDFFHYYFKNGAIKPFLLLAGREHPQNLKDAFPELRPIKVGPLSSADSQALAMAHWAECPDRLLEALLAQSQGNPLFIREYARFARKHRDLTNLPGTIQTMFLTALERYDQAHRDFIKMMAPFVLNFTEGDARHVIAAAGGDPDIAAVALNRFFRDGILIRSGDRYSFALDVLKKALYASLLNQNKRLIHGAIADIMLGMARPHSLRLIHHLLLSERWSEAAAVMLRDPDRNYNYDYLEYIDPLYRRMSRSAADEAIQLLILKSALLFNSGKIDEAELELKRIMKVAIAQKNDNCMGFAYHMICAHAAMSYSFQKARFTGQKALYYYRRAGMTPRSIQNVVRTIAWAELQKNNFEEARDLVDQMEKIPSKDEFEYAGARAEFRLYSGDYRGALEVLENRSPTTADGEGGQVARFFGLDLKLKALWQLCDFKGLGLAARELLGAGALSESVLAQAHAMAACAAAVLDDPKAAEDSFLQAEFYADQIRNDFDRVDALRTLALCRLVSGDGRKAETVAREALIPALRHSCYYPAFTVLMTLVTIEAERGDRDEAAFFLREASYFFTTGLLLPNKDVILYYYYAATILEGELAARAPAIAGRLLEDEKARIGDVVLVAKFPVDPRLRRDRETPFRDARRNAMKPESDMIGAIRTLPGFDRLDDEGAEALAGTAELCSFSETEIVYKEDDTGNDVFYLMSGLMESRMRMPGHARQVEEDFLTLKSGDFFGETSFLDGGRRESTIAARERSLTLRLDGSALRSICADNPKLAATVYRTFGRSLAVRYRDASLELRNSIGIY